jgi:hypothetical protein
MTERSGSHEFGPQVKLKHLSGLTWDTLLKILRRNDLQTFGNIIPGNCSGHLSIKQINPDPNSKYVELLLNLVHLSVEPDQ